MKKLKILLSVVSVLLVMLLSSCVESKPHEHDFQMKSDNLYHYLECECGEKKGETYHHTYEWINGEDPTLASLECAECDWVYDYEKEFNKPVLVVPRGGGGGEPAMAPIMSYQISTEKGIYNIGEEFEITLSLNLNDSNLLDGPFHVKLAKSPYYEIVGDDEYVIEDFCASDYRGKKDSIVDFKFKVRAIAPSDLPHSFEFKIKCNANQQHFEYYTVYKDKRLGIPYYSDFSEDYFITILAMSFRTSEKDIIIGENSNKFFFDSMNRQYISSNLSKEDYVKRYYERATLDMPSIICFDSEDKYNRDCISYVSKNIRARLYLTNSFDLLSKKYEKNNATSDKEIALEVIEILFSNNILTKSQYESEKAYISSSAVGRVELICSIREYQELIPFESSAYDVWLIYNEQKTFFENHDTPVDSDYNSASIYLKESIVPLNEIFEVEVYTCLSREISMPILFPKKEINR